MGCTVSLLAALVTAGAGPLPPMASQPLTQPYQPVQEIQLVAAGKPAAVLLTPELPAYAVVADQVAAKLQTALGVALPRADEAGFTPDGRTIVLLGNVFTGPLTRRLYANHLVCADAGFPGNGYELRTVPDALDLGCSVMFLGGSDPDGVLRAADALAARLKPGPNLALPYLIDGLPTQPAPPDDAAIAAAVDSLQQEFASFRDGKVETSISRLESAARGFYLTGDDAFGRLYAALLKPAVEFYHSSRADPPTFVVPSLVTSLDQVEESAGMTPDDRLRGAEWLRAIVEDTMGYWEMSGAKRLYAEGRLRPIWNHETHPALSVAQASQYLRSHYQVPATAWWEAVCDHLFQGQVDVDQPLEDSANYQWLVHRHLANYVLVTGRLTESLTGPAFRQHLDYAIASHDNQGNEATHGDAWSAFGSIAGASFALGAAIYNDPRYGYLLDLLGRAPGGSLWSYSGSATGSEAPAEQVGLRIFTVHPARVAAYGIEGLPPERVLDKAVFRSGWGRADDYLMLDGLNVGNHKHVDANAVIRYVRHGRLWLADMDYIRAAPKHHNSIVVVRDGEGADQRPAGRDGAQVIAAPPLAAELMAHVAGDGLALTSSLLHDYDGLDWDRSIFWAAGNAFVVVDELTAVRAGDYTTRCVWRTLGEVELDGRVLHATQRGEHIHGNRFLRVLDDGGRTVVELAHPEAKIEFDRDLAAGQWGVNVIAKGLNGGADSVWLQLDDGAPGAHHLPTDDYGDSGGDWQRTTPSQAVEVAEAGRHHFALTLREGPGVRLDAIVLTAPDGTKTRLPAADLVADQVQRIDEPTQHLFIVNRGAGRLSLHDQFDYGHGGPRGYYADYPYAGPMTRVLDQVDDAHLEVGGVLRYANLFGVEQGDNVKPRRLLGLGDRAWLADGAEPLLAVLGPFDREGVQVDAAALLVTPQGLVAAGAKRLAFGDEAWTSDQPHDVALTFGNGPLTVANVLKSLQRLAGVGQEEAAPTEPEVDLPAGPVAKVVQLPAPVTALAGGDGLAVAGNADGKVTALRPDGTVAWVLDAGSKVRSLAAVHRADGTLWAAGTEAGDAILVGPEGKPLWTYRCEPFHGRSGSVGTIFGADLDGDGNQEVVAGSDNWHYHGLSPEGKLLWRTETVHASTVGCAGDLDGDGRDEILAGTEYYWPKILGSDGKLLRSYSGGPVTSAVAAVDLDGDGRPEPLIGLEDCFLRRCQVGGGFVWEANVGGAPTVMVGFEVDGQRRLAVGTEGAGVAFLAPDGSRVATAKLPEPIRGLAVVGDHLLAAGEEGVLYRLGLDGELLAATRLPAGATHLVVASPGIAAVACGAAVAFVTR